MQPPGSKNALSTLSGFYGKWVVSRQQAATMQVASAAGEGAAAALMIRDYLETV